MAYPSEISRSFWSKPSSLWKKLFYLPSLVFLIVSFSWIGLGRAAYPERPVKLIIPWAAGGDTDSIKRVFASLAEKHLGQPVVIANITGASGSVGAREAKNAPPDGYTIFSAHDYIHTTYYTGVSTINFWDFEPICLITSTPLIMATHGKAPWKSFKELLQDAKKRPGQIKVGATLGSSSHFLPAMIENQVGGKLWRYVSYEGTAERMTALMGGHIDVGVSDLTQREKAKAGAIRFLAIATAKRHPEIPRVPTLKELGIDVTFSLNRGLLAPKGTPEAILKKWEEVCQKVAKDPAFVQAMRKQGTDVTFLDRKAYAEFLKKNDALNKKVAEELGYARRR